jgi:hypothetical protein
MQCQSQNGSESTSVLNEKIEEGKKIIEKVSYLKYQMARDHAMS